MGKILIASLLMICSWSAVANDRWTLVTQSPERSVYVDNNYKFFRDGSLRLWVKERFSEAKTNEYYKKDTFDTAESYVVIYCDSMTYSTLQRYFSRDGIEVGFWNNPDSLFFAIKPESLMEKVSLICTLKGKQ